VKLTAKPVTLPLEHPFSITSYTFLNLEAVWVTLEQDGISGKGEGVGVYYLGDNQQSMLAELQEAKAQIESGKDPFEVATSLESKGAANALDCAAWDLRCKSEGKTIWELLGIEPKNLNTVATVGIGSDDFMAQRAVDFSSYRNLKIKLDAERPIERVRAIREARPDASLVIDANQAWTLELLAELLSDLADLGVNMVEQPLKRGEDAGIRDLNSPIPIGVDEGCLNLDEYKAVGQSYDVVNIKLDKCGGLTPALEIADAAKADGKRLMVGNMTGTSLSMAPAFVIGQYCEFVDIDGPLLLKSDIDGGLNYLPGGEVEPPASTLWG
jgi:L-alanine-DL-glutamate epimerase-like enolase superfamily enzyme